MRKVTCRRHEGAHFASAFNVAGDRFYFVWCPECGLRGRSAGKISRQFGYPGANIPLEDVRALPNPNVPVKWDDREGRVCEACGATDEEAVIEEHHWAPGHLFGSEANQWPTSYLCRGCHVRWHQIVTPEVSTSDRGEPELIERRAR